MNKKAYQIIAVVAGIGLIVIAGVVFLAKTYPAPMSCDKAIDQAKAENLWDGNQKTIRQLQSDYDAASGFLIRLDKEKCRGKAFMHINYDTHNTRKRIQQTLDATPLKAIPVEWQNT
jgi:hypothetical protein